MGVSFLEVHLLQTKRTPLPFWVCPPHSETHPFRADSGAATKPEVSGGAPTCMWLPRCYSGWTTSISHHFETMVETIVRCYLQENINIVPLFLRWCRNSSIHSIAIQSGCSASGVHYPSNIPLRVPGRSFSYCRDPLSGAMLAGGSVSNRNKHHETIELRNPFLQQYIPDAHTPSPFYV